MSSVTVCAQCLRALRRQSRFEKANAASLRYLSQSQPQHITVPQKGKSSKRPQAYAASLLGAPTSTGNVTADALDTGASTKTMQQSIASRLVPRSFGQRIAGLLRNTSTGQNYVTYGLTESLFKTCSAQADYSIPESQRASPLSEKGPPKTAGGEDLGQATEQSRRSWWLRPDTSSGTKELPTGLGLDPTFSTWSQITYLHMYLLTVRLRTMSNASTLQNHNRYLLEHFSQGAEDKMILLHSITARGIRNRYLKDLFLQWRGVLAAYDEGLVSGDAVLAAAVWRNLWKGEEDVDWTKVGLVVGYMRAALILLDSIPLQDLRTKAGPVFLEARARMMDRGVPKSEGISTYVEG